MLEEMSSQQLTEWMAFDWIEPISLGWRGDAQAGMIQATLANIYRNPRKRPEAYRAADFMPRFDERLEKPEDLYKKFRLWAQLQQKGNHQ